jgi:hypothetical protein
VPSQVFFIKNQTRLDLREGPKSRFPTAALSHLAFSPVYQEQEGILEALAAARLSFWDSLIVAAAVAGSGERPSHLRLHFPFQKIVS